LGAYKGFKSSSSFFCLPSQVRQRQVVFSPPIHAFDRDQGIGAAIHYAIIAGKERKAVV